MNPTVIVRDRQEHEWTLLQEWFAVKQPKLSIDRVREAIDQKTKPPGSLGHLECVATQLALLQGTLSPKVDCGKVIVFCADHGITSERVSAYPADVTAQMMANFSSGGAAVCVLSASNSMSVEAIDVGVNADLSAIQGIIHAKVSRGTRNMLTRSAMTTDMREEAMAVGREAVHRALSEGVNCLGLGEMGIGNTTSAAALCALLLKLPARQVTGSGTGVAGEALTHKTSVVQRVVDRHCADNTDSLQALQRVGGLEIAAITGAILEAAAVNLPILVDGFISTAAALVAVRHDVSVRRVLFFSHQSAEAGHASALGALDAFPLLSLNMRLGEGSATSLAYPLMRAAAAMLTSMSTFSEAGISGKAE